LVKLKLSEDILDLNDCPFKSCDASRPLEVKSGPHHTRAGVKLLLRWAIEALASGYLHIFSLCLVPTTSKDLFRLAHHRKNIQYMKFAKKGFFSGGPPASPHTVFYSGEQCTKFLFIL
jgi:hypothetical protein